uniref:Uncharacterized protein n=1 Tax=Strombidium inclinatum TaxID=197538 RepID=A0A7S3IDP5_9SPIT|mmetsp:Transcript_12952/g.20060  ORF Transcript_12952/g.20060 Transcript_12952/m.20060 type:complete len:152 (+) Transcript_12952:198-653(+)
MLLHQGFKYKRFQVTGWLPNVDHHALSRPMQVFGNLLEREMAPTVMVVTFLIGVGAFYTTALLLTIAIAVCGFFLFDAYKTNKFARITILRAAIVVLTSLMFLLLLLDNHIFEESTIPQIIEMHMTDLAKHRHGNTSISIRDVVKNLTGGN